MKPIDRNKNRQMGSFFIEFLLFIFNALSHSKSKSRINCIILHKYITISYLSMEQILTVIVSLLILQFVAIKVRNVFSFVADTIARITYFITYCMVLYVLRVINQTLTQGDVNVFQSPCSILCSVLFFVIAYQGLVFLSSVFQQTFAGMYINVSI